MTTSVTDALSKVPVTRLIHFTPAINLVSIFGDRAIRASADLGSNSPWGFVPTDAVRFDARTTHVCCSFEYPNAYYQDRARAKSPLINYPDWVSFVLDLDLVLREGTLFCPCNGAKGGGRYQGEGGDALLGCWADPSTPSGYRRSATHHPAVPTDLQSEVLIPGPIPLTSVTAIVVPSAEKARELFGVLEGFGLGPGQFEWRYAPLFFSKYELADALHYGNEVPEETWVPSNEVFQ